MFKKLALFLIALPFLAYGGFRLTEERSSVVEPPRLLEAEQVGVKAIYATADVAGGARLEELLNLIDRTELNAIVIDVKTYRGTLAFAPRDPALAPFAPTKPLIKDLEALLARVHERGIYAIARFPVFQDTMLAERRPELAVARAGGGIWRDRNGLAWLDPASFEVWKYNAALAQEAAARGFDEINLDYVRFPSDGALSAIRYQIWNRKLSKQDVLREFFDYMTHVLHARGTPVSADLFGISFFRLEPTIGQFLPDAAEFFDFVAPMSYPSHYPSGFEGYKNPALHPYEIVKKTLDSGKELLAGRPPAGGNVRAKVRPWIQDFDLGADYDAVKVRAQIRAAEESGAEGWMLWNARNVYTEEALRKAAFAAQ
ncbi:MAG: putative glycoside hydrolase [Patescibacteria group bacterium]